MFRLRSTPVRAGLALLASVLMAGSILSATGDWITAALVLVASVAFFAFAILTVMRLNYAASQSARVTQRISKSALKEASRATFHARDGSARVLEAQKLLKELSRHLTSASPQPSRKLEKAYLERATHSIAEQADRLATVATRLEEDQYSTTLESESPGPGSLVSARKTSAPWSLHQSVDLEKTFPPLRPWFTQPRRKDITAAVVLDDFSYQAFAYEWNVVRLDIVNWLEQVKTHKPDLLLVESAWHGNGDAWALKVAGRKGPSRELNDLVTWFRLNGIPTVFWNKEDPEHFADFIEAASLFDYVFTTDDKCISKYREKLGHDRVSTLPFAAQTAIHNPAKIDGIARDHDVAFGGTYFHHKFKSRRDQMDTLLNGALDATQKIGGKLEVFSRFQADERYRFPEPISSSVVGSLPYQNMLTAYKSFKAFLNVNTVTQSKTMCARRIFELTAAGTPVVSTPSVAIREFFEPDELLVAKDRKQAENHIRSLLQSPELADRVVHRAQRRIWAEHTYSHRAETILRKTLPNRNQSLSRKPISVLAPTNRPELVRTIFENFSRQSFPMKQLVLITHGYELDQNHVARLIDEFEVESLQIVRAASDLSLGASLNLGLQRADGSVIAKMDDDDYYGADYLGDMSYALAYSRADVVGKRSHYMYLNSRSTLILRLPEEDHTYTDFVIGPTIMTSKSLLKAIPFEDRTRGEDSSLMRNVLGAGGRIYATDRFNFCQVRGSHKHTWNVHDEALLATARVVGFGDPRETVTV